MDQRFGFSKELVYINRLIDNMYTTSVSDWAQIVNEL